MTAQIIHLDSFRPSGGLSTTKPNAYAMIAQAADEHMCERLAGWAMAMKEITFIQPLHPNERRRVMAALEQFEPPDPEP